MKPVRKRILDRYEKTGDGDVIIDVASGKVEDLYEDFDRTAPYHKKDLEEGLVYYLSECVREIGRAKFVIRFTFDQLPSEELMRRVGTSIHKFFMYQKELESGAMKKMLRTSLILFVTGIAILGVSLWLTHLLNVAGSRSFLNTFFLEGLTIVAWVSMWEGLATLLLNLVPHLNRIRQYISIAEAKIMFEHGKRDRQPG
ncbi:MAG: hypothetical protein HGA70_03535 [Chlorobiaceae bacterium]|nr:hypothetical protein [Chlorobiaceae bacterium]